MSDTIEQDIKEFVVSNFLYGQDGQSLANDQSFLENGIIDSTGVLGTGRLPRAAIRDRGRRP